MKKKRSTRFTFFSPRDRVCLALVCAAAVTANANIITVTNPNDSGPGSLRQALADANDGDTIEFAVTGTIGLTSGELSVDNSITISGPAAANLAVNGNAKSRVFHIDSGKTVLISGLTITNGNACCTPPDDNGGGIYNDHATLTLDNCLISGNTAKQDGGGGVWNDHGTLTIRNCTFSSNSADGGGGVFNYGPGKTASLQISNSIFRNNSAGDGGGILNYGEDGNASLDVSQTTFSNNLAYFDGGAIKNYGLGGSANLVVSESTFSGNSANYSGGGVFNDGSVGGNATMHITNTTLSGSSAGEGGAIYNNGYNGNALLTASSSTLNANSAKFGGGILNDGETGNAVLEIGNTILKAAASNQTIYNIGAVTSLGYNLSSDDGGGYLNGPGDQINTDPLLGPLRNNGGPTLTHRPFPGSPTIDAGDPNFTPPPYYDQRGPGFDRVVNGRIDIGSFEVQPDKPPVRPPPTPRPRPTPAPRP